MQFHCSLSGASAPRGPTYSTVQEQQTGFSTWFDDQHAFYVCMGDSLQKKSCRILLEHLKLNGHPIRSGFPPPLTFHDHNGKKNSILGYELVRSIQILDRLTLPVQNLYRSYHLVSEKVVITAFKMHKKVAVGSFIIGWVLS